jgi:shikimate dehydrogenase
MMYGEPARPFIDWSILHGADQAVDGLGMLVEQAAESFLLWRGKRPETRAVIEMLRKEG